MMKTLLETVLFAAIKHKDQRRKNKAKDPYINHPIEVATLIQTVGKCNDENTLKAALLHDVVEDTNTSIDEIINQFGKDVANIVMEVTDDKSLSKYERKINQINSASKKSHEAKVIKLADKLSNLSSLADDPPVNWDKVTILGYFIWSYKVISNLRGTNEGIEAELDKIFSGKVKIQGQEYDIIPKDEDEFNNRWLAYVESIKNQ